MTEKITGHESRLLGPATSVAEVFTGLHVE